MKSQGLIRTIAWAAITLGSTTLHAGQADPPAVETPVAQPASSAKISDEARKVLDQISEAYSKLKSLELTGTFTGNIDAAGQKQNESAKFTASFESPNKFRHAMEGDILCGSTGDKVYSYLKARNIYTSVDAPKDKVAGKDLPSPLPSVLEMQDPSLMLALAKDPSKELTDGVLEISVGENTKVGDISYPTLLLALGDKRSVKLAIDPQTHLVRQSTTDARPILLARGVPDVKSATFTVDYALTTPDSPTKPDQFAWAPPEDAKDFAKLAAAAPEQAPSAMKLEGKAAPDFKVTGLDGKVVTLAELKGKVVVLDFWATWCGPCRASLPHLQKLYESKKAEGVVFYAVDLSEEKPAVQKFVSDMKLTVPVLLDSAGDIGNKYAAEAIPETVVIGKDGNVKKVFVGFNPESSPAELAKAVAEAQK